MMILVGVVDTIRRRVVEEGRWAEEGGLVEVRVAVAAFQSWHWAEEAGA